MVGARYRNTTRRKRVPELFYAIYKNPRGHDLGNWHGTYRSCLTVLRLQDIGYYWPQAERVTGSPGHQLHKTI